MEFSHVGGHCEMEGCNQQDFLPFKCNLCSKNLCLLHRSAVAHSCVSAGNIDVISIPCPICGKSIKMNRSDDANAEWDRHFTTSCEQKPSTSSSSSSSTSLPLKCASPTCSTILGPSNQLKCNFCNRQVCISHRTPEAHKCKEYQRANMLQNQSRSNTSTKTTSSTSTAKPTTTSTTVSNSSSNVKNNNVNNNNRNNTNTNNNNNSKKKSNEVDASNTLRGTAARRQQNQQTNSSITSPPPSYTNNSNNTNNTTNNETVEACPVCGEVFTSLQSLTSHLDAAHFSTPSQEVSNPTQTQSFSSTSSSTQNVQNNNNNTNNSNNNTGREVCPQCSKRFHDIVELIQHVERDHATTSTTKSGDNCGLC